MKNNVYFDLERQFCKYGRFTKLNIPKYENFVNFTCKMIIFRNIKRFSYNSFLKRLNYPHYYLY